MLLWIGNDANYYLGPKIWGGGFYKNKKNGWVVLNTADNNLYYSMKYNTPIKKHKLKDWKLAPKQNSYKKELLKIYNDPWMMEHSCKSCKRITKLITPKNKKSKKRTPVKRTGKTFRGSE